MSNTKINQAEAAGFESINTNLDSVAPGTSFQVKWRFKNTGTTTWNGTYKFVYTLVPHAETATVPRSPLGSPASLPLSQIADKSSVKPGQTVTLTLKFKAPNDDGTFATNWQLQAPDGKRFGPTRWMRLVVPQTAGTQLAYRMVEFTNSVSNFNDMQPGHQFTATWTLQNSGTAVWKGDFKIAYVNKAVADTQTRSLSQMGAPASTTLRQLTGRERVNPGESVDIAMRLVAPTTPGAYAFHWQLQDSNAKPFGDVRWMILGVSSHTPIKPELPAKDDDVVQFGMNVNINNGHPLDANRMNGLGYVRWVYWASREKNTPEQAFQKRYRKIIQTYAAQGIRSLIIFHQDTFWGNGPWQNGGSGDWATYARQFGEACGRAARVCAEFGDQVAYQIYNEQDSGFGNDAGNPNHSAIGIAPANYALILKEATAAIRKAHPGAPIVFGGLKTGPDNALNYVRQVQQALGGKLPMDALAYHPYGRFVNTPFFNFGSIGKLSDALDMFKKAYPKFPLWISEVGVAADSHIGSEHYEKIALYIREVVDLVANQYADYIEALIWFGWTDIMRNAGVNTRDNKPKAHVFEAFEAMRDLNKGMTKSVDFFAEVSEAEFVSFTSTAANLNKVPAKSEFTCRWKFKNTGTTTWDKSFKLVHANKGDNPNKMTKRSRYTLTDVGSFDELAPGETAVFTLDLTAPDQSGRTYRSFWQLQDPKGKAFAHFYVDVAVTPASTVGTAVRTPNMKWVKDLTALDGERMVTGMDFEKQWRVRNTGQRHWGEGFRLVYVEGDLQMARNKVSHIVPSSKPGEEVTLSVPMTAPQGKRGTVKSAWRMQDDRGNNFGDPLWVEIEVVAPSSNGSTAKTPLDKLLADPSMWYSQVDPQWKNIQLGNGRETIGTWGCLLTCMAMALSANGMRFNSQELNQRLKSTPPNRGGFKNDSVTNFLAPWYIGGLTNNKNIRSWQNKKVDWTDWTGENPISRIDNGLKRGHIVVAQVDSWLNTAVVDQHWVVIVKRAGDDYLIIDPLTPPDSQNRITSLKERYMNHVPSETAETNLRNAIISTMIFSKGSGAGS